MRQAAVDGAGLDMADSLARLNERDVAAFYRRFAQHICTSFGNDALAAALMLHWLDGGGRTKTLPAQDLRNLLALRSYLKTTARAILLSIKPLPNGAVDGVVPRIRGTIKSNPPGGPYPIHLDGVVETPLSPRAMAGPAMTVAASELNALYALDGWTVSSDVVISATPTRAPQQYDVKFERWTCKLTAGYVWTRDKEITVPNPDHGLGGRNAVSPGDPNITIANNSALRVENAGMANPFVFESDPWDETDIAVVGPARVRV
jgi:hypothetical protein